MKQTQVRFEVPAAVADVMDRLASERGLTRPALFRQALGVLQTMHDGAKDGYYTGMTRTRENLETLLVAPL